MINLCYLFFMFNKQNSIPSSSIIQPGFLIQMIITNIEILFVNAHLPLLLVIS